jgi:hypothetical protein
MQTTSASTVGRSVVFGCAILAMSVSGAPALAAPGGGGGGGHRPANECVTLREYEKVHAPMTRNAVHKVFDTSGTRTSVSRDGSRVDEVRVYDVCTSPDSTVTVSFTKRGQRPFRLSTKTAVFV